MKILNFGSCNIDYVYSLDHIVKEGETETTYNLEIFPGGKGLNQSIAVARAGACVYHAGYVGVDGEFLKTILSDSGVDLRFMQDIESKNGHAVIQVSANGENSIFIYPGSNEMLSRDYIDSVLKHFGVNDMILLQNEINEVDYIVEKAYEKAMTIVFNPSPYNQRINQIDFHKLSYIILNEVEAKAITGFEEAEKSLSFLREHYPTLKVMLTIGVNGSILMDGDTVIRQTAYEVTAVDTTAAGDTFTGYFVAGIAKGIDFYENLKCASVASAIAVSRKGAAPSIPTADEVLEARKNFKSNKISTKSRAIREQIENYTKENIKTANLDELAAQLGYGAVYAGTLVKKLIGESFIKYLQRKRCEIAANKLLHSDLSISEIIREVGYENETFFRKIFKQKYGKNPLEFRKRADQ